MTQQNEAATWEATDAQGNEFGKEANCPYYKCHTSRTFVGHMGYNEEGEIVEVKYECENCGHSYEWAQDHNVTEAARNHDTTNDIRDV